MRMMPEDDPLWTVLTDVAVERARQDAKHGGPPHDDTHTSFEWWALRAPYETLCLGDPLMRNVTDTRCALVELAALAVAQIESLDRKVARCE